MKNTMFRRVICFILSVTTLLSMLCVSTFASEGTSQKRDPSEENPYDASTLDEMKALVGTLSYKDYLASYSDQRDSYIAALESNPSQFTPIDVPVDKGTLDAQPPYSNPEEPEPRFEYVYGSKYCDLQKSKWSTQWQTYGADTDSAVYLPAEGTATWAIEIDESQIGFYYIQIEYYSVKTDESSISNIERKLRIGGEVPFDEVSSIKFDKKWAYTNVSHEEFPAPGADYSYDVRYEERDLEGDAGGYFKIVTVVKDGIKTVDTYHITQDINGNSMSPTAEVEPAWHTYMVDDSSGYYDNPFEFYVAKGRFEVSLEAEREPMIVKSVTLIPVTDPTRVTINKDGSVDLEQNGKISYAEYINQLKADEKYYIPEGGEMVEIRAEFPDYVSDSAVTPTNDNTSALNTPISHNSQLYNVIGENSYNSVGQWAAYKFRVTKSGLYSFAMRYKQDALQGMFICRTIKLSGGQYGSADGTPEVPFAEAYEAEFNYDKKWQSEYVGKGGTPFMFYFEEGVEYTVYFECSLGSLKDYIQRVENSLNIVNSYYLRILQLTGTDPDENRDYNFMAIMDDAIWGLLEQAQELEAVKKGLEELCGTNGSHIATLETVYTLLDTMGSNRGRDVAANMSTFKSYLGTLGTWINSSKSSKLVVDGIWVVPAENSANPTANEDNLPKANAGFFKTLWFEIKSFFSSFFVNYDQMGLRTIPDENTLTINVWLATGRDQSQIWRTMIDAEGGFTARTGTAVSLKLVTGGTLLPSILSRKGPDVYMGLGSADVINYAIRDAVLGISGNVDTAYTDLDDEDVAILNEVCSTTNYVYDSNGNVTFESKKYSDYVRIDENFAQAAMDTVTLRGVTYGIPQTMGFAMMFYRMDILANLDLEVPESWQELLSILPVLQTNNMSIGVSYIDALDFMIYQRGGSMWKYTDTSIYDPEYAGAKIDLDSEIAQETFDFTCRLYSDYSFPVSYDASNRFRTGEMPIVIGGYSGIYNTLTVYATEIEGLWEFCSLPGSERADGTFNYDSLAGVSASVILHGCEGRDRLLAAWQFLQWQTDKEAQAEYGNKMVALIGPSAKYDTANLEAMENLSWTAKEKRAIRNQMAHLSSIVNYPGSYIITRYTQFAFLEAVNESADPIDALNSYINAINTEIARKRQEFGLWIPTTEQPEPPKKSNAKN